MSTDLKQAALDYHEFPKPGKISVELSKPAETAQQLALAYSPGVAEPVREIAKDPANAYRYTGKGNLVAVISDGTAILGLGNLGPLASKPVMEGKALLFKRFAGIDSVDIEVNSESPQAFIDTVTRIADTFGGINLEDIKAPECFEIERVLIEQCDIPVFHDDQHGTAIVTAAGMINALEIQGKNYRVRQDRLSRRRRRRHRLHAPAGEPRRSQEKSVHGRPPRRDLSRTRRPERVQGRVPQRYRRAHAGRCAASAPMYSSGCRAPI